MTVLITGSTGRLGQALVAQARQRGHRVVGLDRVRLPLEKLHSADDVAQYLDGFHADALIHTAAITAVDACEGPGADLAWQVNARAPEALVRWAATRSVRFIHLSTDYVFGGAEPGLRGEEDPAQPVQVYGQTKRAAELAVLNASAENLVARVSWVFGPEKPSALDSALRAALTRPDAGVIADKFSLPLFTADGAAALLDLLEIPEARGLVHLCNPGPPASWLDWAQCGLNCLKERGFQPQTRQFHPLKVAEVPFFSAARPVHTAMDTTKLTHWLGRSLRPWQDAVAAYLQDWQP